MVACALISLLLLAGCASIAPGSRGHTVANGGFETDLIAGAGQGWPGTGYDAGDITVTNDGTNLYVTVTLQDGWQFQDVADNLKVYVGTELPDGPPVKLGQFPYKYTESTASHTFTIPLADFSSGDLVMGVHADVTKETAGGYGRPSGNFASFTIYTGSDNGGNQQAIGTVTLAIQGGNLVITATLTGGWYFVETHAIISPDLLDWKKQHAPGKWPYGNTYSSPYTQTTDIITIPLSAFGGDDCADSFYYLAWHAAITKGGNGTETALAWSPGHEHNWINQPPQNWWRYTDFTLPDCTDNPGSSQDESAWGFDIAGDHNPFVSCDEDGWLETLGLGTNWGWFFNYSCQ